MVRRTILVLDRAPDERSSQMIALETMADQMDQPDAVVYWRMLTDLPDWIDTWKKDQLNAHRRDAGDEACFMLVIVALSSDVKELRYDNREKYN